MSSIPSLSDRSNPFTQFYAQLLHQGNMLADSVRTETYQRAIFSNSEANFKDKVVLDVGMIPFEYNLFNAVLVAYPFS